MAEVHYSPLLVFASVLVAIMAAFTCLRLTNGLRNLPVTRRKIRIAQASIALGGGIWSMHYIGMLAVTLPFYVSYDPLLTLGSALIAILITGSGLLMLHFGERTRPHILIAGTLTGIGIASMHYTGMAAISDNCILTYSSSGIALSVIVAIAASTLAMWLAYSNRSMLRSALGAVVLGLSISAMHYVAMVFTAFSQATEFVAEPAPMLDPETLAMTVSLTAFVLCGLFLLLAVPMEDAKPESESDAAIDEIPVEGLPSKPRARGVVLSRAGSSTPTGRNRIPYEKEGAVRFMSTDRVLAIESDGHYTRIRTDDDDLFCPWSLSDVEKSPMAGQFLKTHRRYLVNTAHISGLKKVGDHMVCYVGKVTEFEIPVSRSRAKDLRQLLGV